MCWELVLQLVVFNGTMTNGYWKIWVVNMKCPFSDLFFGNLMWFDLAEGSGLLGVSSPWLPTPSSLLPAQSTGAKQPWSGPSEQ